MLNKSKSIEEIYNEVKDYDLVITNDAPLATALNKLVEKPRLEYFAMTPRQIAYKFAMLRFSKIYSKAEIILEIYQHSKKPFRQVHQSAEKIFEIWNNTGMLENCLQFLSNEEKDFVQYLEKYATAELAMERFDEEYYGNKKIAVIGIELFNLLDKQILPKKFLYPAEISLFKNIENKPAKTYIFNSTNGLINRLLSVISSENESEVAVVLNTGSDYLNLIKSGLKENGINLQIKNYLSDDIRVRNILSFIDFSFRTDELTVKDISLFENLIKFEIDRKYNNFFFKNCLKYNRNKTLKYIYELMKSIDSITYKNLFHKLKNEFNADVSEELIKILKLLDIYEKKINEDNYNLLNYFLMNIDVETSQNKEGVLFVNARNSAFIDRPVIFYIGMDESWTKLNPDKSYINKADEEIKNLQRFQILLSQGEHRFYFVTGNKNNQKTIPCYYFNILADRKIKNFENEFFNPVIADIEPVKNEYKPQREKLNLKELNPIEDISPSSLNDFIRCPKLYSYNKLTRKEEQPQFLKGTLLHKFAEYYFNHPEYSKENFEKILNLILDEYHGFVKSGNSNLEKTLFTIGMTSVINFIDENDFKKYSLAQEEEYKDNFLFKKTGKLRKYYNTEERIKKNTSGIKGKIDLFSDNIIVDYKASKTRKQEKKLLEEFKMELLMESKNTEINFQTAAYLAGKRAELPDKELRFVYSYLFANSKKFITDENSETKTFSEIKYLPVTFKEYILSKEYFEKLNREINNGKKKNELLIKIGYSNFKKIIEDKSDVINFYDFSSILMELEELFFDMAINKLGFSLSSFGRKKENTFRKENIYPVLKSISNLRLGVNYEAIIFSDDLDVFLELVKEKIKEINLYQNTTFPNKPVFDLRDVCKSCNYLNICIGNKLWITDERTEDGGEYDND